MFSKLYLLLEKIRTGLFFQQTKAIALLLWTNTIIALNTVKNSCHFAEFVRGKTLKADQVLVSFDVVSLFTNIPV